MSKLIERLAAEAATAVERRPNTGICLMEEYNPKLLELILNECRTALSPMLRDMISRGQAISLIEKHFSTDHDWLIRKVPNTKEDYYVEYGNPPLHVMKAYNITDRSQTND